MGAAGWFVTPLGPEVGARGLVGEDPVHEDGIQTHSEREQRQQKRANGCGEEAPRAAAFFFSLCGASSSA